MVSFNTSNIENKTIKKQPTNKKDKNKFQLKDTNIDPITLNKKSLNQLPSGVRKCLPTIEEKRKKEKTKGVCLVFCRTKKVDKNNGHDGKCQRIL